MSDLVGIRSRGDVLRRVVDAQVDLGRSLKKPVDGIVDSIALSWDFQAATEPKAYVAKEIEIGKEVAKDLRALKAPPTGFERLQFRYLGGLAAYPTPTDVRVAAKDDGLRVDAASLGLATVPYDQIIGAWPFPDEISLSHTRLGFLSDSFAYFPNPTYRGGGIAIAAAQAGSAFVLSLGNRSGWLTPKGDLKFYASLSIALALACVVAAGAREAEIGPWAYATELDLALPA